MSSPTDRFFLALHAYQQVRHELLHADPTGQDWHDAIAAMPLDEEETFSEGMLLLGVSESGRALGLDVYDPEQGSVLISGDGGCGKTSLLHALAVASADLPNVFFGALTPFPQEWRAYEALPNCLGIWRSDHPAGIECLRQIMDQADALTKTRQVILLLVDNFDLMNLGPSGNCCIRWLVTEGPTYQIWPVLVLHPMRLHRLGDLLEQCRTRIFGHVRRYRTACLLTGEPPLDLGGLIPGLQFYLSSPQGCERFWIPPLEGVFHERWNAMVRQ
ncbi:MAG: hypothetical protein N2049_10775 [Anaerolineales bacterium]|nr:hypothetical protein [Anaerolineales bacterium]